MPEITTLGEVMAEAAEDFLPASALPNDSGVTGTKIKDALDALLAALADAGTVDSVFGRVGAVVAAVGDYAASQINNDSAVPGTHVDDALEVLAAAIPSVPVSSVFGRIGAVIAAIGDYAASQVTNDSSVSGARVSNALDTLLGLIPSVPVSSVFGRVGAVIATLGDYAASKITNDSSVSGSTTKDALNNLLAAIPSVPVSSVFGRVGAVIAAIGDYTASQVTNDSSVSGARVSNALNNLLAAIPSVPVSSVFGRVGAVIAAIGDYSASQVTNDSSVSGARVSNALNTLLAAIAAVSTSRDAIWDRPTTPSVDDDEMDTDPFDPATPGGTRGWNISVSSALGTPLVRDGAISLTSNIASGHFRSSCRGGALLIQLRPNEFATIWKTVAGALSTSQIWFTAIAFPAEPGTTRNNNPFLSLAILKNLAGIPDLANRSFVRALTNVERTEVATVIANVVSALVVGPGMPAAAAGLAMRVDHGSSVGTNFSGWPWTRAGWNGFVCQSQTGALAFNSATDKIGITIGADSSVTVEPFAFSTAPFSIHFLRRVPTASGWLAQA